MYFVRLIQLLLPNQINHYYEKSYYEMKEVDKPSAKIYELRCDGSSRAETIEPRGVLRYNFSNSRFVLNAKMHFIPSAVSARSWFGGMARETDASSDKALTQNRYDAGPIRPAVNRSSTFIAASCL